MMWLHFHGEISRRGSHARVKGPDFGSDREDSSMHEIGTVRIGSPDPRYPLELASGTA